MTGEPTSWNAPEDPIYSDLAVDPDARSLVELFVSELPDRLANMLRCAEQSDWEELRRLAHQLKGACGSYGFHQLTPYAAELESACSQSATEIVPALGHLRTAARRARSWQQPRRNRNE